MPLTSLVRPARLARVDGALAFAVALLVTWLAGCGGSGDGDNAPTAEPLTVTLTGVAATGAAIANADLKAVNANGAPSRAPAAASPRASPRRCCWATASATRLLNIEMTNPLPHGAEP